MYYYANNAWFTCISKFTNIDLSLFRRFNVLYLFQNVSDLDGYTCGIIVAGCSNHRKVTLPLILSRGEFRPLSSTKHNIGTNGSQDWRRQPATCTNMHTQPINSTPLCKELYKRISFKNFKGSWHFCLPIVTRQKRVTKARCGPMKRRGARLRERSWRRWYLKTFSEKLDPWHLEE